MLRIIVAGGRDFNDIDAIATKLSEITHGLSAQEVQLVSGGARGADKLGEILTKQFNCNLAIFPAQWNTQGKSAGYKRNALMAQHADILVACWDGKSRGTKHMIDLAKGANLIIHIIFY